MAASNNPDTVKQAGMIRVVLTDDHRHIHDTVSTILGQVDDIRLVAQGSNGEDAIRLCEEYHPDIVLMDIVMPGMDGVEATRVICKRYPEIKILVLSSFQDHETVFAMLESGASGYIVKHVLAADLVDVIRAIYQGKAVFSSEVVKKLLYPHQSLSDKFELTQRELEVLKMMAEGRTYAQIAHLLTISQSTVRFHSQNILDKMGVLTRSEALVLAAKSGLI